MRSFETMNTYTEPSTSSVRNTMSARWTRLPHARNAWCWTSNSRCNCVRSRRSRPSKTRRRPFSCRAEERNDMEEKPAVDEDSKIKQTLAGLDALLGIEAQETIAKEQSDKKASWLLPSILIIYRQCIWSSLFAVPFNCIRYRKLAWLLGA